MNQSDQQPSESPFNQFFSNLWAKILTGGASFLAFLKSFLLFFPRSFWNILTNLTFSKFMFCLILCAGIAAALVSALIEYEVVTAAYSSETDIIDLPFRGYKFLGNVLFGAQVFTDPSIPYKLWRFLGKFLFGARALTDPLPTQQESPAPKLDQQIPPGQTPEQDSIPKRSTSWIPFLLVFALEVMKCGLIYYRYYRTESSGIAFTRFVRYVLIGFSAFFTLIFVTQLMHEPNEDKINEQIEMAEKQIKKDVEDNDDRLSKLKKEHERLSKRIVTLEEQADEERDEGRGGRDAGPGTIHTAIRDDINTETTRREQVNIQIKNRQKELDDEEIKEKIKKKTEQIRKGGSALDPKWMSAFLSMVHGIWSPDTASHYPRWLSTIFMWLFSGLTSLALECIIIESFKRVGKEIAANLFQDNN